MKTRTYFGVVIVAYSYPPGSIEIVFECYIKDLKLLLSAPVIPQSRKCRPSNGTQRMKLLPNTTACDSFSFGYFTLFVFNIIPYPYTL